MGSVGIVKADPVRNEELPPESHLLVLSDKFLRALVMDFSRSMRMLLEYRPRPSGRPNPRIDYHRGPVDQSTIAVR